VVPTVGSIETEPAPREKSVRETVALDLWRKGDVPTEPKPAPAPATEAQPVVDPGQGNAQFRSMDRPGERETAYTEDFALIKAVEPVYPPLERSEGIEGTVTVEMLVDEYGMVVEANVLSIMGPDSFAESALHAVRQFVFDPPKENGQPKRIWVRLRIKFRISG
jgi:TonB family protein